MKEQESRSCANLLRFEGRRRNEGAQSVREEKGEGVRAGKEAKLDVDPVSCARKRHHEMRCISAASSAGRDSC